MWFLKEDVAESFLARYESADATFWEIFKFDVSMHGLPTFPESTKVIAVQGILTIDAQYLGTTYTDIVKSINLANEDYMINEIVLAVNSPGGSVDGSAVVFDAIKNSKKKITAIVMDYAASAAYMMASQADEILMLNSLSSVGSLGIVVTTASYKGYLDKKGIQVLTFTNSQSPYKRIDLTTDEGGKIIQKELDDIYLDIEARIASSRKVSTEFIRNNFGRGKMLLANEAITNKMVDGFFKSVSNIKITETITMTDIKQPQTVAELMASYPLLCASMIEDTRKQTLEIEKKRVKQWLTFINNDSKVVAEGILSGDELDIATGSTLAIKQNNDIAKNMIADNVQAVVIDHTAKNIDVKAEQEKIAQAKSEIEKYL